MGRAGRPHSITHRESAILRPPARPPPTCGTPHRGLGFSPDMASAFTNRPLGRQRGLYPSSRSGSLPHFVQSALQSQTWGLAGAPAIQSCPDPLWSRSGAEATRWDVRLWDLGLRLPSWAAPYSGLPRAGDNDLGELGSSPSTSRNPEGPHSQLLVVSVTHTHVHTHTHSTDTRTHSSCLPSTAPEQSATLDPTYRDSGPDGAPRPHLGPTPLCTQPPPHHHHLPAIPSGSHLLAPLGLTEEKHPFPEPHFLLSLLRAFLCTHRMYFCVLPRAALSMYKIP